MDPRRNDRRWLTTRALVAAGAVISVCAAVAPAARADDVEPDDFQLQLPELMAPRPRHVGHALLESAAVLVGGTVWYWSDLDFNTRDWDLRWDWASWKSKLTLESVRFDQNIFQTNAVSHPRAGFAQYQIMRGNGFGMAGSVATTLASSVFWEYIVEFKEMPSLNDMVVNTTAGLALGEPFYQLGEFFLHSSPTLFSRIMAGVLSPVATSNDWLDGRRNSRPYGGPLGLDDQVWHRFALTAGLTNQSFAREPGGTTTSLGLSSDLVMLPGYLWPGRMNRWTRPGDFTAIEGQLAFNQQGFTGGSLFTRTSVMGRYLQSYRNRGDGHLAGSGAFLGLGSAFEYESFDRPDGDDYLAVMSVLGPLAELTARSDGLRLRLTGELYGDFAMVKSLAMSDVLPPMVGPVYRPGEHGGDMPSVLGARGYYYAYGLTGGLRAALDYWAWDAGAELRGDRLASIGGYDRFQDEITHERDLVDRRVKGRAWLGLRPWGAGPRVSTVLGWRWRRGTADEVEADYLDTQIAVAVTLVF
jgi:hypothetical protein